MKSRKMITKTFKLGSFRRLSAAPQSYRLSAGSNLLDAGTSANGVVLMDVGINPSNTVHRAALRNAEAIAVVIKAEIPDIAHTRHWIGLMIDALAKLPGWSEKQAR